MAVVAVRASAAIRMEGYGELVGAMAKIAAWIIGPSMVLTVIAGLLSMAATPAFQNTAWAWAKAATGIVILESGLQVLGPIQDEATNSAIARLGAPDPAAAVRLLGAETATLWLLLAVSAANIALGVWRPRLPKS